MAGSSGGCLIGALLASDQTHAQIYPRSVLANGINLKMFYFVIIMALWSVLLANLKTLFQCKVDRNSNSAFLHICSVIQKSVARLTGFRLTWATFYLIWWVKCFQAASDNLHYFLYHIGSFPKQMLGMSLCSSPNNTEILSKLKGH